MTEPISLRDAERAQRKRGRLYVLGLGEITPALDSAALVKGLLGEGGMSVIFGEPNCGKTFFALDIAMHVAMGAPWCGRKTIEGCVVYLAAEGGHGIRNRVAAFRQAKTLPPETPFFIIPCPADLRERGADTDEVIRLVNEAAESCDMPARLLVVDTLARVMAGGNENSPDDMGAVIGNIDRIRDATKAHCCIIHHSGKDTSRGERGHSSLRGAVDTAIEITRDGSGTSIAKVTKQKDLPTEGEFAFTLESVELGEDGDGERVTSCVITHVDAPQGKVSKGPSKATRVAFAMLRKAIDECGEIPPAATNIPSHVRAVSLETWRRYWQQGTGSKSEKPESLARLFRSDKKALVDSGLVMAWGDWFWIG